MDEEGVWKLFFATGLPQAYLAIVGLRQEAEPFSKPAMTAFRTQERKSQQI
ncbi:MAG: hypothetical protein ACOX7N_02245 [Lawsonibacter sp.]|jgi:hypothetical protein